MNKSNKTALSLLFCDVLGKLERLTTGRIDAQFENHIVNGVTRGLSQGKNVAERGPLTTVGGPQANIQKKT